MNRQNPQVDGYLRKAKKWREELSELRRIILDFPLTEEVKWRHPCYTFQRRNILMLGGFKEHCVISFVRGALLKDAHRLLAKPGEDTQSSRVMRFTGVQEILKVEPIVKTYIHEAIDVEKAGLKVPMKKIAERAIPNELQNKFDQNPAMKAAFRALTPGRQRAYLIHFSSARQSKTREARIERCTPRILGGKGLDD